MFDVRHVAGLSYHEMHIIIVITLVGAGVLLDLLRVRALNKAR
jgi:hypothetical protein